MARHFSFWLIFTFHILVFRYYLYDLKYLTVLSTYVIRLQNLLLFLPVSVFYAYFSMHYLLPRYILKGRYVMLALVLTVLSISMLLFSYYVSTQFNIRLAWDIPLSRQTIVRQADFTFHNGLVYPLTVSSFAIGIKMAKNWYLQQKANDELTKQKINKEVQLLKAQIHPGFLFHSLEAVYRDTLNGFEKSPAMILKLSDLLSYILYESNEEKVPLEKELNMVQEYLALKKLCYQDAIEFSVTNHIENGTAQIAPLLLLPVLQSMLAEDAIHQNELVSLQANIYLRENNFNFTVTVHAKKRMTAIDFTTNEKLLQVKKRLGVLYTNRHIFDINVRDQKLVIALNILLDAPPAAKAISTEHINLVV